MRDPFANLSFAETTVRRRFLRPIDGKDFVASPLAQSWVAQARLVPFQQIGSHEVESPKLPFVTYPTEWCDSQLHAAAQLTLALATDAANYGFDLQDASAWNIIFDGCMPKLCDLGSPQQLTTRVWWAAGQYTRHFVLPLLVSKRLGVHGAQNFAIWRDGIPPEIAARMLGPRRYLTRYWPMMAKGTRNDGITAAPKPAEEVGSGAIRAYRSRLYKGMELMIDGVNPRPGRSRWRGYMGEREHYAAQSATDKLQIVDGWLQVLRPAWVADLGCNTGEFSVLAAHHGAQVAAIDSDHACIDAMFQHAKAGSGLHPVLAVLDDLPSGRGMAGEEYPGLDTRMRQRFDLVLMLAIIHHLAIAAAVPLGRIAQWIATINRRWLAIELIGARDQQLQRLCLDRRRKPDDFCVDAQLAAFVSAGYQVRERRALPDVHRELVLLERLA